MIAGADRFDRRARRRRSCRREAMRAQRYRATGTTRSRRPSRVRSAESCPGSRPSRDLVVARPRGHRRYGRLGGSQFAAAISYRALFSLVPLATFVATILAQVLSVERRQPAGPRHGDRRPARSLGGRGGEARRADHVGAVAVERRRPRHARARPLGCHRRDVVDAEDARGRVRRGRCPQPRSRPARQRAARARRARPDPLRGDRLDARERRQQGERERRRGARLAAVRIRDRLRRRRPARR